ncbi:MAG: hypothetical protein AAFY65_14530 [Pseudomonadota bacterium]
MIARDAHTLLLTPHQVWIDRVGFRVAIAVMAAMEAPPDRSLP